MSEDLVRTYTSNNSTYLEYSNGEIYLHSEGGGTALEKAVYLPKKNADTIWNQCLCETDLEGLTKLIDDETSLDHSEEGGRIISITREKGKVGIRRSGIINAIKPNEHISDSKLLL